MDGTEKDGALSGFSSAGEDSQEQRAREISCAEPHEERGIPFSSLGYKGSVAFPINGT